jgi:putative SOS response-associated peptidase YedK
LFAFAGIWERRTDPSGHQVKTRSILATTPNAVTSAVLDRMPVILYPDSYDTGLDPGMTICRGDIRPLEALRCSADAGLSSEHSRQQRGEARTDCADEA